MNKQEYKVIGFLSTKSGDYAKCLQKVSDGYSKEETLIDNRGYSMGDKVLVSFDGIKMIHVKL